MEQKYWYRLLTHFYDKNYFANGLTLPYIIGSKVITEPNNQVQTIKEFFEEVKNENVYLSVLKCCGIGELVFSLSNKSDFEIYGGFENIVDIDGLFDNFKNINDFSNYLQEKYGDIISQEKFSRNHFGKWERFTADIDLSRLSEL
ncbi:hypothetical protein ACFPH8_14950 [Bizionia hallyeonensis]|uniref:Uncharacterized protein n=1 Tax=Bizionia hallyeonensis TaxID=1123757 RepID=A0ABW0CBM2_9FLAO